ncbi:Protein SDA1 [Aphelenchoides fujianensis]|nr:Protein SDA1 [Aphelenchoides fujianensis]
MADQDRKREALRQKREQLEQIRREKEAIQRNRLTRANDAHAAPAAPVQNGTLSTAHSTGNDLDQILETVGLANAPAPTHLSQPSSTSNLRLSNGSLNNFASDSAPSSRPRPAQLEVVTVNGISVAPKNDNHYSKGTQTIDTEAHLDGFSTGSRDEFEFDEISVGEKNSHLDDISMDDTSPDGVGVQKTLAKLFGRVGLNTEPVTNHVDEPILPVKPSKPPDLTQEQREKILASESFQHFLSRSSRWIERAIAVEKDKDIFADYTNERKDNTYSDALLTSKGRFNDGQYVPAQQGRALDFSDSHPELLAVAVNGKSDGPEGIVNIWNTNFSTTTPECVFHSNSPIKAMCFAKFHPKLILGGCSTGQLCMWDLRANKRNPVTKSPISARSHTQEIVQMSVVGSQHSHELVTVSLDGIICWWSLDNLHTPVEKLTATSGAKKALPILSIDFDHHDVSQFVCGAEDGFLYLGDKNEPNPDKKLFGDIAAHDGSVTCVNLHKTPGPVDFSRYCLTSSTDFTCKLWNLADKKNKEIFSFENKHGSYVESLSWSPVHPAVFISTSLNGTLNLRGQAIAQSMWSRDGRQIATLDETGLVQLYDVHETCAEKPNRTRRRRPQHKQQQQKEAGADGEALVFSTVYSLPLRPPLFRWTPRRHDEVDEQEGREEEAAAVPTQLEPRTNTRVDGDNLCLLQEFVRKDPESYAEEFEERLTHFLELSKLLQLQPALQRMEVSPLIELTAFLSAVAFCYPTKGPQFASSVMDILRAQGAALEPDLRMAFLKAIVAMRNRDQVDQDDTLELFFDLVKCDDKQLRKFILGAVVSFIRRQHRRFHRPDSRVQSFVFARLKDGRSVVVRVAQLVMIEAFRRGFWRDAKTANAIAESIFSKTPKVQGIESDSEDEDENPADKSKSIKEAMTAFRHAKKTKKRQKQLEDAKKAISKQKKSKKEKIRQHCNLEAMRLLFDPQTLADRLYGMLDGRKNERFALRLLIMGLTARLIGVHQLQTLGFYSYLHKYLQPKQREVTRILLYAAQACHELVPTDIVQDLVRCIAQNFVSDRNTPEAMTVGLNAIREVFVNCPFAATEELLSDLSEYKSYKDKNVSMAARGLVQLFRAVNPQVLRSKDRGRPTEATREVMEALAAGRVKGFGKHDAAVDFVPGAEILPLKDPQAEAEEPTRQKRQPKASGPDGGGGRERGAEEEAEEGPAEGGRFGQGGEGEADQRDAHPHRRGLREDSRPSSAQTTDRRQSQKKKKNGPHVGRTNQNMAKNKNFAMVQHKFRGKNRQRSFRDQQISLRNYLIRQSGKKV